MINDKLVKRIFNSYLLIGILALVTATIGMLVDGIVIGQFLGAQCVSAFGLANPIIIFTAAVAGIFSNGGSVGSSIYMGRGDDSAVRLNFTVACVATLICAILFTIVFVCFDEATAKVLGADETLIPITADYVRGIGLGMIPTMMTQVLMIYIRLNDGAKLSFLSVICMTVCNITLDLYFAVILELGMFGMGLATSISYLVAMLVCCTHLLKKNNIFKFIGLSGGIKELGQVVAMGIPSALNRACMTVRVIALNYLLIAIGGSIAVSALAVQNNINQMLSAITMGVGMTATMLAGVFFGERDGKMLEKTLRVSMKSGVMLSTVAIIMVMIFAKPIVGLFLEGSADGLALAVRSLRLLCLSLPLSLVCTVLINFYQCTKNLFMANLICVTHGLMFVVAVSFALAPVLGTDGVWISFLCAEILTILMVWVVIRIKSGKWARNWSDMALIPKEFIPDSENILDISIKGEMEQVMELSSRIHEFCDKHTTDTDKVRKLSLCIEEMAGNIACYGKKKNKPLTIDIRIVISDEYITFRLRDDGIPFNPVKYDDENQSSIGQTIGIRMVRGITKDMKYTNAVGMNNLVITI